jgi:hypothetical protein
MFKKQVRRTMPAVVLCVQTIFFVNHFSGL